MCAVNNDKVNQIYEATLHEQANNAENGVSKPTPATQDRSIREKFIRAKYQEKRFLQRDTTKTGEELNRELWSACQNKDLSNMQRLLPQSGVNVNWRNAAENNLTALHEVVIEGWVEGVVCLLQNRAEVGVVDEGGWTPMHFAAEKGATHCANILFKYGEKLNTKDIQGQTPVDIAMIHQHADCVTFLRLANLAQSEIEAGNSPDEFMEALENFSIQYPEMKAEK
jgi:ankyrin repeat protein